MDRWLICNHGNVAIQLHRGEGVRVKGVRRVRGRESGTLFSLKKNNNESAEYVC